jgi:hypothetical protein
VNETDKRLGIVLLAVPVVAGLVTRWSSSTSCTSGGDWGCVIVGGLASAVMIGGLIFLIGWAVLVVFDRSK